MQVPISNSLRGAGPRPPLRLGCRFGSKRQEGLVNRTTFLDGAFEVSPQATWEL